MVISKTTQSSQSSLPLTYYNGSGVFKQWYAYGNYIDEVLAKGTTPWPVSAMFYIHDHLYSPAALTDFWGTVLERYEYDAYGSPTIWNADFTTERDNSNYGNPYLFTGRRVDIMDSGSLKIQYNRNRYYDYYSGRWLTHDPLSYVDGMNLYEYAKSNPVLLSDPSGLFCPCLSFKTFLRFLLKFVKDNLPTPSFDFRHKKKCVELWITESIIRKETRFECQSNKDIVDKPCSWRDITTDEWREICGERWYSESYNRDKKCERTAYFIEKANVTRKLYKCRPIDGVWKWTLDDEEFLGERIIMKWSEKQIIYRIPPGMKRT